MQSSIKIFLVVKEEKEDDSDDDMDDNDDEFDEETLKKVKSFIDVY